MRIILPTGCGAEWPHLLRLSDFDGVRGYGVMCDRSVSDVVLEYCCIQSAVPFAGTGSHPELPTPIQSAIQSDIDRVSALQFCAAGVSTHA
jgi:hypothetical protein